MTGVRWKQISRLPAALPDDDDRNNNETWCYLCWALESSAADGNASKIEIILFSIVFNTPNNVKDLDIFIVSVFERVRHDCDGTEGINVTRVRYSPIIYVPCVFFLYMCWHATGSGHTLRLRRGHAIDWVFKTGSVGLDLHNNNNRIMYRYDIVLVKWWLVDVVYIYATITRMTIFDPLIRDCRLSTLLPYHELAIF